MFDFIKKIFKKDTSIQVTVIINGKEEKLSDTELSELFKDISANFKAESSHEDH